MCGQDALVWDVPERGTVPSDVKMGLDWTGSGQENFFVVRLFIMITSGGERVIVGRDCNECVNNCTAGMWEIAINTERMRPIWHKTNKGTPWPTNYKSAVSSV